MEEEEVDQAGPSNASDEQQHKGPVELLAAAAATLAGCKIDKQEMLPMWGHKGRRSQGQEVSPVTDAPAASEEQGAKSHREINAMHTTVGRNLRPRSAKRARVS